MALDAVIFDLDGTLVDTNRLHAQAWKAAMETFGYSLGEDRILLEIGKSGSVLVPTVLGRQAEEVSGDALREKKDEIYNGLIESEGVRLLPGANEVLKSVRGLGLRTALSTGSAKESVERAAGLSGLDLSLLDEVVTDDDVEIGKPNPDAVAAAVKKLDLSPAQCVKVGDTPYDVESARRAGVLCLGVETGAYGRVELMRSGARGVYRHVGDLAENIREAVANSSPGEIRLTWDAMRELMRAALDEAGLAIDTGDIPVGVVLAGGDGRILSRAHSRTLSSGNFLLHGEMQAFQNVVELIPSAQRDLILVSTLEPCTMCFGAAMGARVDTIIYALSAPSNGGIGRCEPMQSPGMVMPRVIGGLYEDKSLELFREWNRRNPGAPFVEDLLGRWDAEMTAAVFKS